MRGGLPPNSKHRALVTPARRGKGARKDTTQQDKEKAQTNRHVEMSWAQRLKRVFIGAAQASMYNDAASAAVTPV